MSRNKKILLISLLSFVSFFSTLWIRSADLMESRNFISAREIVLNNEWFVTTLNGEYRFEKPPLPTWLTALVMKIFNNFSDEWLLRVPVALICLLLVFYIYKLVK
ncbi:ArnT family glycosyltransferase, partial [Cetobacterium sp.]